MKKTIIRITVLSAIVYLIVMITSIVKNIQNHEFTLIDLAFIGAFLVYIAASVSSADYPLISGLMLVIWTIIILILYYFHSADVLYLVIPYLLFPVLILGIFHIFIWWKAKSKW